MEFDAGPELRELFLKNWLVNLSGEPGRYLEKDLMQEHHNDVLEERMKRSDVEWDSKQMRDTHSRVVHHTERIKKEMRSTLELLPKGWKHPKPHDRPEIKILLDEYHATRLHEFRRGRKYQSSSEFVDEFTEGMKKLPEKLGKWKVELAHSDLMGASLEGFKPVSEIDDVVEDEDEELVHPNVSRPTGGCREFVNGELQIIANTGGEPELMRGGVEDEEDSGDQ